MNVLAKLLRNTAYTLWEPDISQFDLQIQG